MQAQGTLNSGGEFSVKTLSLHKVYRVGRIVFPALRGVNLSVRSGELVSIMGPSGSGKSTLLNLIGALDRPSKGRVLIDGVDIFKLDDDRLAEFRNRKVGFVFQTFNLIPRVSVIRNVELPLIAGGIPPKLREARALKMLRLVGLEDKVNRRSMELSGGEQQRVAIARALVTNPSIILADEPTGNLDTRTGREIISSIKSINRAVGTSVIIVTHDPEVAKATERIIYLRDGRVEKEEMNVKKAP
ncbi:ABC transporter ATP-binding protein [Candidatus Bathyarchaeota archaeon]|nr:ABC transporter ATP-binding protein [Candidatus Bathyarchaeota archaeon]